jgi:hypothetical protein
MKWILVKNSTFVILYLCLFLTKIHFIALCNIWSNNKLQVPNMVGVGAPVQFGQILTIWVFFFFKLPFVSYCHPHTSTVNTVTSI